MSIDELARSCCVCKSTILHDGRIVKAKEAISLGYKLTHTFLSKACVEKYYLGILTGPAYHKMSRYCGKVKE